jgi:PAS domain S-box-containing protein
MSLQTIYVTPLVVSAMIAGALAWYTWRHRQTEGAKPFTLLMLAIFQWGVCYILQLTSTDLAIKTFWDKITFIAVVTTPVMWLLFALEYTGRKEWISRPRIPLLFVMPFITLIVIWTNEAHHLFWTTQEVYQVGDLVLRKSDNGLWFWVHALYSYALILAGTVLIVRALLRWPAQYRRQMAWILFAVAAPWLANAITVFNLLPILIDLTPFAFTVTGVGMAVALFRHRLLDLVPIARDLVIEGMKDGMIVLDASDRIVDINQAAQTILNLSGEQAPIGKQLADVLIRRPDLVERYGDVVEAQDEFSLGEGEAQRWYELTLSPLHSQHKIRIGRLLILRDITDRKLAEDKLRQLSRAVEASPTSIVITDTEGNIQYINPKFTQVTGYSFEEALGKNPNILKTDQTPVETYHRLWEAISSGREWRGEFCNRKKNGELYWELASISPIDDASGNITHYVAIKEDITERKRTESLLQESEARFRLFVENASDLIYRTDANGYITYANQPVLHVLGYSSEAEVIGKHYLELTTSESHYKIKRAYNHQLLSRTKNTYHEFPTIAADGREVWLGQNVQLITEGDQVVGFQAIARDITAIKQAQEALHIAYDQALEASRAKSQLLAKVSHELRTPLGGILGYAELLQNGTFGMLQEGQMKAADEILQSSHYLTLMVNELLDEAQIQANTATLQENYFSPAMLLQQATSGMEIMAQRKGLEFSVSIDPYLPHELYGDDRRLRQILVNLIGNAIKFTKEGSVHVRLQSPDPGHWIMQVTDTGIGVPNEAHSSIFEPFQQADNAITRENRGIGLGLSITKQLVELMGGRIVLESQVGVGSTFTILLPIVKQPA